MRKDEGGEGNRGEEEKGVEERQNGGRIKEE